jgi:hypothetical protein
MIILRWIAARLLVNRLLGGGRRRNRRGGRGGFFGPFPYYSTRTRRGSRVTVSGCCLPLALAMLSAPVLAGSLAWRRVRR